MVKRQKFAPTGNMIIDLLEEILRKKISPRQLKRVSFSQPDRG